MKSNNKEPVSSVCIPTRRFTTLSFHGKERLYERSSMSAAEIVAVLDAKLCVNLGRAPASNRDHLLFWSTPDQRHFVAIRDYVTGRIVTVLPEHFHARSAWKKAAIEEKVKARELMEAAPRLKVVANATRFPMVNVGLRPVRDGVVCQICQARKGERCFTDWGKSVNRVHIQRLDAYEQAKDAERRSETKATVPAHAPIKAVSTEPAAMPALPPEQGLGKFRVKVWYMRSSGRMKMLLLFEVSKTELDGEVARLLAKPHFSERIKAEMTRRGLLFESVFKAYVFEKRDNLLRIVEFSEHIEQRYALRLRYLSLSGENPDSAQLQAIAPSASRPTLHLPQASV